ncbi:MAG: tRNA epoxyqueuosine(34) reductase QueG [Robiginitomaculum sp.]|nr:tRNA epoxyqueuosine(34) reductase QueG [Robiginitomaculum sp.]
MTGLSKSVKARIETLGFSAYGIVDIAKINQSHGAGLLGYIKRQHHGTMDWMPETAQRRSHPQNLWPQANSALVLGMNYGPDSDPLISLLQKDKATISVYARNKDYHGLIKGRLKELAGLLARDTGEDVKVFVDTAPLMEKPLAAAAGLGWQGKHTNLVSRDYGSWLFLGVILSAAKLTPTPVQTGDCGTCRDCLDICPTDAFPNPYQIDARKCISYLTIEFKGKVELDLREKLGNRIYGCDDCLAVCPWNKFAQTASEAKLQARPDLDAPDLAKLATLDDKQFRTLFAGSPIKRIGRDQFIRNVLYAIGNSSDASLMSSALAHTGDNNPVISNAAIWAVGRLQ